MNLSSLRDLDFNELRQIDLNNIGSAPTWVRNLLLTVLFVAILAAGYYFDTSDQRVALHRAQAQETTLRNDLVFKARRAANLKIYEHQLAEMKRSFGKMLQQLPNKTEIPGLLVDISQTALSSGLEIDLFRPEPEQKKGFYAIKPIQIQAKGTYPEFAHFVSEIAALPRIVTLGNINMHPVKKGSPILTMSVVARTYRYLPDNGDQ
ncbi:pilus assembly protein PilO [Acidihalobacter yilgarnensis]|uniref:Pilus assembly protein PilO n=1 Tax=Acidihalobacter yilgarnensis TaxID=2819280 RepID=A0A1D8IJY3_9GAMM|nr:type 4a pilus biogenesis protein PilO [Acidihalobacter yilgarnensis]AOU96766.1 pilus assembly protein PilO [Acidihalobacter yilgarnensis]